jgi:hypothetical protein
VSPVCRPAAQLAHGLGEQAISPDRRLGARMAERFERSILLRVDVSMNGISPATKGRLEAAIGGIEVPLPSARVTTTPPKLVVPGPITVKVIRASSIEVPETALQAPPKTTTPLVPKFDSNGPPGQFDPFTTDTTLIFEKS